MKYIVGLLIVISTLQVRAQDMKDMHGMKMPENKLSSKKLPTHILNDTGIEKTLYTCIMHPQIVKEKPGNCPICGMRLIKKKSLTNPVTGVGKNYSRKKTVKDSSMNSTVNMSNMHMESMDGLQIDKAKEDLGSLKYLNNNTPPHTVVYHLFIKDTIVHFGKKFKRAIAANASIPMPTLTFTEGDTAEVWVHNLLKEETAMHWHGLLLPNKMDGVPYLTQMPIKPGATYVYRFTLIQSGTHWYHSHSGLQQQIGMYGTFIINKRKKELDIPTVPLLLTDWIDMNPMEVDRSLHNQTDWFGIRKNTIQSYSEALATGNLKTKLTNEWKRMTAMDVSDIAYDNFLINGKIVSQLSQFTKGDKVRLRIANGASTTYFWLNYSGGKITVIASDGNDVEPVEVDRLLIAVSETYDVIITIPDNKSYEFLVTPEDRTKAASLWLGAGEKVPAQKLPKLKYFAGMKMMNQMMDMRGNMIEMKGMQMANQVMDMNAVMYPEITGVDNPKDTSVGYLKENEEKKAAGKMRMNGKEGMNMNKAQKGMAGMDMSAVSTDIVTLNYSMLKAPLKTTLPSGPFHELKFELTGNMNRYVWSMDNNVLSESDDILIRKGENVRIIMYNNSMMRHPMHLHGHDFRLLNGQGDYAILKNVIDIMPMEKDTVEFAANADGGDWFFHCHILYHMMSGMGRIFRYDNVPADKTDITDPKFAKHKLNADDRMLHIMAKVGLESSGTDGEAMLANTRYKLSTMWHLGMHAMHGYESETMIGRYLGRMQWWYPYIGFDYHYKVKGGPKNLFKNDQTTFLGQSTNKNNRKTGVAGIAYTLPTLTIADARLDGDGKFRFQLSREDIPLTPRIRMNWMLNTDKEYAAGLRYILGKYISISSHYDSDMGLGAGITLTY